MILLKLRPVAAVFRQLLTALLALGVVGQLFGGSDGHGGSLNEHFGDVAVGVVHSGVHDDACVGSHTGHHAPLLGLGTMVKENLLDLADELLVVAHSGGHVGLDAVVLHPRKHMQVGIAPHGEVLVHLLRHLLGGGRQALAVVLCDLDLGRDHLVGGGCRGRNVSGIEHIGIFLSSVIEDGLFARLGFSVALSGGFIRGSFCLFNRPISRANLRFLSNSASLEKV